MKKRGEKRFDEKVMSELIAEHLHYNMGHSSDEILSLASERSVFKEDGRDHYELCSLLLMLMVHISNQGVNDPVD